MPNPRRGCVHIATEVSGEGNKLNWADTKATLKEVRLWLHYIVYFCVGISVSLLSLFAPTIVQELSYTGLEAQLFTIPLYAYVYILTMVTAYLSDNPALHLRYIILVFLTSSVFAVLPPLYAWVSDNVRSTTARSLASGLNIVFIGPGQIVIVWIY
ncbi:uncharacterized protein N7477_007211 [Penicillium maclennaniae]|uniref:uncharacterized protein n=1 Tax=Penicillium maclennaniae TaxID=1343394 RepID=UPI002540DCC8|nr:uncharacterized protein N7477_007211 [Penicillium maclennaniae]KAJ5668641.1 hypothetical protein N7477_007211 [Penicillium maclennaniae]